MFTGIIEKLGEVTAIESVETGARVRIAAPGWEGSYVRGESIAIDGCCLTVESWEGDAFEVFASLETLRKTTLGDRRTGSTVNLERAMVLGGRLGGHLVSGHVDGTGHFIEARPSGQAWEVWIGAPADLLRCAIPKGSITVDGISLTIVELLADRFSLWIIPETWERTALSQRNPGDRVNLETDLIGKYVFRFLETTGTRNESGLEEVLKQFGKS